MEVTSSHAQDMECALAQAVSAFAQADIQEEIVAFHQVVSRTVHPELLSPNSASWRPEVALPACVSEEVHSTVPIFQLALTVLQHLTLRFMVLVMLTQVHKEPAALKHLMECTLSLVSPAELAGS